MASEYFLKVWTWKNEKKQAYWGVQNYVCARVMWDDVKESVPVRAIVERGILNWRSDKDNANAMSLKCEKVNEENLRRASKQRG